jgi:hypothetical protein
MYRSDMAAHLTHRFCSRIAAWVLIMLVFLTLDSPKGQAGPADLSKLFLARPVEGCPVATMSKETYRTCENPACPLVPTGTVTKTTNTGWGADQCGFHVLNGGAQYCTAAYGADHLLTSNLVGEASRFVDFGKRQCRYDVNCDYQQYGPGTCATKACGIDKPAEPKTWQSCPLFSNGLDQVAFKAEWNGAAEPKRRLLGIVLLLDEQRHQLDSWIPAEFVKWSRTAEPTSTSAQ